MPDFIPVPPTNAITDKQVRAVLDVLSQNIQISIDKFNSISTGTTTSTAASKGGFTSFGTGVNTINNNTSLSASYTKANMIADSASLFAAKLNKSASDILSGPIDFSTYGGFKTAGMTIAVDGTATGQGVAFTSKGIVGRNSTTTTFTLDSTTGDANFYGNISGGANINILGQAKFNGNSNASFTTNIAGTVCPVYYSSYSVGSATSGTTGAVAAGVFGYNESFSSKYACGVLGIGRNGTTGSVGVYGDGITFGVYSWGSLGVGNGGTINYNGVVIQDPSLLSGGSGYYLRGDGVWSPISGITAGVSSFNGRPGAVTLLSSDVTSALGYTPYDASNPSGYVTSSTSSLSNYSTTSATISYINSYAAHQFNADSGTAYVSSGNLNIYVTITGFQSAGSGNTITIQSVSDRALKQNITPEALGLDFIKQLVPVSYSMIKGDGRKMHGFIAQDVAPLISGDNDALKITNPDGTKGIDYLSLIGPMVKAIQDLSAKVDALQAKSNKTEH